MKRAVYNRAMANRPEEHRIPNDMWKGIVRYGVTPSMNLVINDGFGAFLFLERMNEPVKGHWWVPGSRLYNGETKDAAIVRILEQELGLREESVDILHISDKTNEEIYPFESLSDQQDALERYGHDVTAVHYWAGVSYLQVKPGAKMDISLDSQSGGFQWLRELPANAHPYLHWYFQMVRDAGFKSI